jgi:hypothetical protein
MAELEPANPFQWSWHHEAIAVVLENATGKKTRSFINAPPRSAKSSMVSVIWIAFLLGHEPAHKFICASYSRDLAEHLGAQCRRLMQSKFYQRLFPNTRLSKATEAELVTTAGGYRIATSVGATLTGFGADTLVVDDPLKADEAYSEVARNHLKTWFNDTLFSRLNNKAGGAIIVVCQRLHEDDLPGMLIEKGWDGLVLPAIAPRDTVIRLKNRIHPWRQGQPLQPREPLHVLEELKRQIGEPAFAAQYLQDPMPETGNMLNPAWLKQYDHPPVPEPGDEIVFSRQSQPQPRATIRSASFFACATGINTISSTCGGTRSTSSVFRTRSCGWLRSTSRIQP